MAITEPCALAEEVDRFYLATQRFAPHVLAQKPYLHVPGCRRFTWRETGGF